MVLVMVVDSHWCHSLGDDSALGWKITGWCISGSDGRPLSHIHRVTTVMVVTITDDQHRMLPIMVNDCHLWWLSPSDGNNHGWWLSPDDEDHLMRMGITWWRLSWMMILIERWEHSSGATLWVMRITAIDHRGWSLSSDDEYHGWWVSTPSWSSETMMYTMGDENHSNGYHWAITLAEWWLSWVMVIMVSKDHGWWESASDEDFHGWWLPLWVKVTDCWHSLGSNYHWMKTLEAMKQVLNGCGWPLDGYCVYEEWESWSTLVFSDYLLHSLTLSECHTDPWSRWHLISMSHGRMVFMTHTHDLRDTWSYDHSHMVSQLCVSESQSLRVFVCGSHGSHSLMVFGLLIFWSSDLLIFWPYDLNVTWSHGLMTTWFHVSWSLWHTGS